MDDLIKAQNVSKIYGEGRTAVTAINQINLSVRSGEVVMLLGPSGSGKTTLLSILGCLLRPTQGDVFIEGQNTIQLSDRQLSRLRCREIGFVFQSFNLLSFMTARKNVEVILNLAGVRGQKAKDRATELLHQVQLGHRLNFLPRDLSGGEKQRVSIARALANNPKIILADEPTGSLDSKTGHLVMELLTTLARQRGSGIVIVTHDSRITAFADRVLYVSDGSLIQQ